MNRLSNRTVAIFITALALIGTLVAVLTILREQIAAAGLYIEIALGLIALLLIVLALYYVLSRELHKRQMRLLAEGQARQEIKDREEAAQREHDRLDLARLEIENKHQIELAMAHAKYVEAQAKLTEVKLRAEIDKQRVVLPSGHSVVYSEGQGQYIPVHAAPSRQIEQQAQSQAVELQVAIPAAPAFSDMCHLLTVERLILCYTAEGPAYGTIDDLLSMAVTGKPGRGKTTALMYYVSMLLKAGAEVFVWDPHGVMADLAVLNGRTLRGLPSTARVVYLDRKMDIVNSVPVLLAKMDERDELYRRTRKTLHPLMILADELPVLADYDEEVETQYKALNKRLVREGREEEPVPSLIKVIRKFVLEARKWRCFFIGSGQSFDAEILPTRVTENFNSRIVFFSSDKRARMSGLENDAIKRLLPAIRRAGSGVMVFDCSRWDGPVVGAIPYITVPDMLRFLGVPVPTDIVDTGNVGEIPRSLDFPVVVADEDKSGVPSNRAQTVEEMVKAPIRVRTTGDLTTPVKSLYNQAGDTPEKVPALELGPEDRMLNDLQIKLFIAYYYDCGNIGESLRRIRNERGQGLGNRYARHASWIVRTHNLKKRG